MTLTITVPGVRFPLRRMVRSVAARFGRFAAPARPVAANLLRMPLTVAGWACISTAPFMHSWHVALGLVVTAVSAMILEHQIADE